MTNVKQSYAVHFMTYSLDASGGNVENTRYDRGLIQTFSKEEANRGTQTQIFRHF